MDKSSKSFGRDSPDSIGHVYDEDELSPNTAELTRRVQVTTPCGHRDREWSPTDDLTTDTTGFTSSSRPISNFTVHHRYDDTLGFSYSGAPADVVCFRSCIWYQAHSRRSSRNVTPPEQTGPFRADVLCIILLFIPVDMREILRVSHTCRFWRFYANYAPHWTYYRRIDWGKSIKDLPTYIRKVVVKPKIVTQNEYFRERIKVRAAQRHEALMGRARHVRWCIAIAVLSAAAGAANFVTSYFLSFLPDVLRSDEALGIATFLLMFTMVVLEVTVVIVPLGGASTPSHKNNMMHLLSWGVFLLVASCLFGTIAALAMARVQSSGHVLDGTTLDLTLGAECSVLVRRTDPSFALLPAPLHDLRWRELTMDSTGQTFAPYCIPSSNKAAAAAAAAAAASCYVFLFFDAAYASAAFHGDRVAMAVGTRTALGFDPVGNGTGVWCAVAGRPPVVAVSAELFRGVRSARDALFAPAAYDDPALRPKGLQPVSNGCSADYSRSATEAPEGSTRPWYDAGVPWSRHYIPLVTNTEMDRKDVQEEYDHFFRYTIVCYIIPSALWFIMLIGQCMMKDEALIVLGVTATVAVVLMNPIVLITSGVLCANLSDHYFMCNASTGGAMVGGGISLTALLAAIYVCFY